MYVVTAQQMRDIDQFTIRQIGIPGLVLMENAGTAVVREVERRWPEGSVVILAGSGNNGGDGLVIARHLKNRDRSVQTWLFGEDGKLSNDCRSQLNILHACGYQVKRWNKDRVDELTADLQEADVIIDAMLGTGATGDLRDPYWTVGKVLAGVAGRVVAVDIPTGVDSDSGEVGEQAVKADVTVTFACPKWGHFLYPGAELRGDLVVADISIPPAAAGKAALQDTVLTGQDVNRLLPRRPRFSHKGTYGHVLVIAGSKEMPGAPVMTATAALRTGCGLLTLAVPQPILPVVGSKISEPVFWEWPDQDGHFARESVRKLAERSGDFDVIAVGPGISTWSDGNAWLADIIAAVKSPLIIDADALNLLARNPGILQYKTNPIILTPHPGEMARLCGVSTKDIEKNRAKHARTFAFSHGVFLVLKGAYTLLATPDGRIFINPSGSAALAKGGSGDILTGMIAGMMAQVKDAETAIKLATYLHGLAGEICGEQTLYATLAGDVIQAIGPAIERIKENAPSLTNFPGN
ncbi:bifunctional ADP-dependent NAD(P)H-hydrate dehydratase/NAD(P)H-hydrate epimerase [Aneurinibacillus terranovensis]|uniref:bifunctional ADP-dependent NAD(P)H-hydrate dehydratase/NAD(P)H-hydrate epimerase n=1 Tax=Aneurinibacillus terranovensis TaxID=278991 RepID=UPI000408DFD7|nr:bifunctional ADP-dependent NAD(P)H-hydrate dehydratase/NAD(P)H-hydrate epimerase [Aneurinibacillus terranovensis]